MANKLNITLDYVLSILNYDEFSGIFKWKHRPINHFTSSKAWACWNARYAGTNAGNKNQNGYIQIKIDKKLYKAHRLAMLIATGIMPEDEVDHIDGDKSNNKISNLRRATKSQNNHNRTAYKTNSSGLKCVSWKHSTKKYFAYIVINNKSKHLGYFDCPAAASFAYQIAADVRSNDFARAF